MVAVKNSMFPAPFQAILDAKGGIQIYLKFTNRTEHKFIDLILNPDHHRTHILT